MQITHPIQIEILRNILLNPQARFRDLNTTELSNDHFTFHLKRLLELNLLEKVDEHYRLTPSGMEIAGRIDIRDLKTVAQPKLGVALTAMRSNSSGEIQFLLGKRKKDPSMGKVGWFTEKAVLGEAFTDTCSRCLTLETGYSATSFRQVGVARYREWQQNELSQDVVLICFVAENLSGELIPETTDSENYWLSLAELSEHDSFEGIAQLLSDTSANTIFYSDISN